MPGVIDLNAANIESEKFNMLKQQQGQEQWNQIFQALQQMIEQKKENQKKQAQTDFLKKIGFIKDVPELAQPKAQGADEIFQMLDSRSQPGQYQLPDDFIREIPTGKTRQEYDPSKIPAGMSFAMPDTGFEFKGQSPDFYQQLQMYQLMGNKENKPTMPSFNQKDALRMIPEGDNPEDYNITPKTIMIKGMPITTYTPEIKPEIIAGRKKYQQEKVVATQDYEDMNNMVDSLWGQADKLIPSSENGPAAFTKGIATDIQTLPFIRANEKALAYNGIKEGTLSLIIRKLGEKGTLTDQDVNRVRQFIPTASDSTESRNLKKEGMKQFISSKIKSYNQLTDNQSSNIDLNNVFEGL